MDAISFKFKYNPNNFKLIKNVNEMIRPISWNLFGRQGV